MPEARPAQPVTPGAVGQFFLEIAGLVGIARLGWHVGNDGVMGFALAALFVAIAAGIWGVFRTPGFVPTGNAPVAATPGPIRLVIELGFFLVAAWGLWISGWDFAAIVMFVAIAIVYWTLRERTLGLLRNRPPVSPARYRPEPDVRER
ncbi:MAG TPA: YrdB family protein [Thermomicrobiales bacterium]|nr:YrdB family protein [Thermomicrobiales bacterium]